MPTHLKMDDKSNVPVFHPNIEEFANFSKYISHIETQGAHKVGICKIVPPKEWIPRAKGYDPEDFDFVIEKPLRQCFSPMGEEGSFQTKCIAKTSMTIKEYRDMATNRVYKTPAHSSHEDLEKMYWKSLNNAQQPIYGADVTNSITDPEIEAFNIAKLDTILKFVSKDSEETILVSTQSFKGAQYFTSRIEMGKSGQNRPEIQVQVRPVGLKSGLVCPDFMDLNNDNL